MQMEERAVSRRRFLESLEVGVPPVASRSEQMDKVGGEHQKRCIGHHCRRDAASASVVFGTRGGSRRIWRTRPEGADPTSGWQDCGEGQIEDRPPGIGYRLKTLS